MTDFDSRDPELRDLLAEYGAEREFVMRMAMYQVFDCARGDPAWSDRIDVLLDKIKPDEDQLALLLVDAERAAEMFRELQPVGTLPKE